MCGTRTTIISFPQLPSSPTARTASFVSHGVRRRTFKKKSLPPDLPSPASPRSPSPASSGLPHAPRAAVCSSALLLHARHCRCLASAPIIRPLSIWISRWKSRASPPHEGGSSRAAGAASSIGSEAVAGGSDDGGDQGRGVCVLQNRPNSDLRSASYLFQPSSRAAAYSPGEGVGIPDYGGSTNGRREKTMVPAKERVRSKGAGSPSIQAPNVSYSVPSSY